MLSKGRVQRLLKTLEEPPEHVKFLLRDDEIEKVRWTVRSRCQRFDHAPHRRRPDDLASLDDLRPGRREGQRQGASPLIARARRARFVTRSRSWIRRSPTARRRTRKSISEAVVRDMLGVADRSRVIDLFEALMRGDIASALSLMKEQYDQAPIPPCLFCPTSLSSCISSRCSRSRRTRASMHPSRRTRPSAAAVSRRDSASAMFTRAWQILTKAFSS